MSAAIEPRAFRGALGAFATGVTIVTTRDADGHDVGLTANSFNSVSLDPPMVLWSLAKNAASLAAFTGAEHFAVHVLASSQQPLSDRFARRGTDKFAGLAVDRGYGGVPLLPDCSALFQCRTAYRYEGGDHVIFVGEVIDFDHSDKPPLVFHGGAYAETRQKVEAMLTDGEFGGVGFGRLVTRVYTRLIAPLRRNAERHGLSAPQRYMLNVLMAEPGGDLAAINAVIGHTGVRVDAETADDLARRHLVSVAPAAGYRLTDTGRQLVVELLAAGQAVEAAALGGLSDDERYQLRALLTRVVDHMPDEDGQADRHISLIRSAVGREEAMPSAGGDANAMATGLEGRARRAGDMSGAVD